MQTTSASRHPHARRDRWRGAIAGATAALAFLATTLLLGEMREDPTILDALAELALRWLPVGIFSALLRVFGVYGKTVLLLGIAGGITGLGAIVGRSFAAGTAGARRVCWGRAIWTGLIAWTFLAAVLVWTPGIRASGAFGGARALGVLGLLLVACAVFALVLAVGLALLRGGDPRPVREKLADDAGRRRLLVWTPAVVAALALLIIGREARRVSSGRGALTRAAGAPPSAITPNGDFYVISKNFVDPRGTRNDWSLEVDGAVKQQLTLTRADLAAMAGPDFVSTLTCISNEIGGPLISTARWSGAPLAAVLTRAGVQANAQRVVFHGRDGYTDSLPLDVAQREWTTVVWAMNGEALPANHGNPVRLIVPGRYGIKNVKWLTRIEVVARDYDGYWQERGWTQDALVKTSSRIDAPAANDIVTRDDAELAGIAFGGDRGINRVEVSTDGGDTWTEATIAENPSAHNLSWVIWRLPWRPESDVYDLRVRATDGDGVVQTQISAPTLPDGASGWHGVTVGVA